MPVFGIVAEGARADLVLLHYNPLVDIDAVKEPVGVMLHGAWWSADALHQILEDLF